MSRPDQHRMNKRTKKKLDRNSRKHTMRAIEITITELNSYRSHEEHIKMKHTVASQTPILVVSSDDLKRALTTNTHTHKKNVGSYWRAR